MSLYKIKGNIITPMRVINNGEACFEADNKSGSRIIYVGVQKNDDSFYNVIDCSGKFVAPGFIDIHVHGGGGHDFMDGTVDAFLGAARLHASHGTATLLPTTLTCPDEELFEVFEVFEKAKNTENDGSFLAGLHLEGPYFSKEQKGAQDENYLKLPKKEHYTKILEAGKNKILRWSVAPELVGALELGTELKKLGITASIGHSDALYEQAIEAYESGYTLLTHFYSGMSTLVRKDGFRYPGLIESGYMLEDFDVEVIADGCHLPPSMLKYVYRTKGAGKVALITDAMRGAGQTEGETILGSLKNGFTVYIEDGVAKLADRKAFGGSVATTDRLVRNMVKLASVDICDAVRMMTMTPAKLVNLKTKGVLSAGFDADFTIFDDNINVEMTISNGKVIFERDNNGYN
ncbi:MAG: N-acetylglucosamine-6-phosphate deacetylase [Clostridiales bacterium GWF2_36_10]|nr:MAG: N-acetylglucosamine-6-phosphate deacetylase [Clostridiales bacterium GWF2_36_10]HAN20209.1 N-acetylglucosamine-6-phosphate deacetylase [Clostridiales bacterium]